MKNINKIISIFFLIGGIGIIVASFFLFLEEYQESNLFYLNMVATSLVFFINFISASDIFAPTKDVAKSSSGYGLRWYGIWLYTPLTLILIILSIIFAYSFDFCLISHIVLLFVLLVFFFFAFVVKNNTNVVIDNIENTKAGLKEIYEAIDMLDMHNKLNKDSLYQEVIDKLREEVRYITASDKPVAVEMEGKLIEKIRLISSQIERNSQPNEIINAEFKECMSIIDLRKKQF